MPVIVGDLEPLLADDETIDWLARQGEQGACLCSVCAGAFLLARTGRLKGRKATTHWNLADSFAERFPDILLKREKMLVDEGDCITAAGGVSAYLDLSLYLQQLRIEAARKLLETTAETIDGVTLQAGYEDISSFRKLFKRHTGLSPSAYYRKKFSCLV